MNFLARKEEREIAERVCNNNNNEDLIQELIKDYKVSTPEEKKELYENRVKLFDIVLEDYCVSQD